MAIANNTNPKAFGAKQQGVRRDDHGASLTWQFKMNVHVGPGKQLPGWIIHVYFRIQGSRCQVDGLRGPGNFAVEGFAGKFIQRQSRRGADACRARVDLRNGDKNAKSAGLRKLKQFRVLGEPAPALISHPVSVLRTVITPSNGA